MSYIVDRRLNSKKKSTVNRQRFLRRYRKHIQKAVSDAVTERSITDIDKGEQISIPRDDISEPVFQHGNGGHNTRVLPGNKEFIRGDRIPRPEGGGGGGGAGPGASDKGEGMDDFVFQITQEEFLDFMFEDLALPNLVKRQLSGNEEFKMRRAGIANEGNPGRINIVRSLRSANARRIALTGGKKRQLSELEAELAAEEAKDPALKDHARIEELLAAQAGVEADGDQEAENPQDLPVQERFQPFPRGGGLVRSGWGVGFAHVGSACGTGPPVASRITASSVSCSRAS